MSSANLTDVKDYEYGIQKIFDQAQDFLPINGTDYVELYVGNAKQAAHFYKTSFGFPVRLKNQKTRDTHFSISPNLWLY